MSAEDTRTARFIEAIHALPVSRRHSDDWVKRDAVLAILNECQRHVHVAGRPPNQIDRCEACGHDLRALCHERAGVPS